MEDFSTSDQDRWEDHYLRGETPWDKGAPAPGLVSYLEDHAIGGRVLVPGCGLGHDVRALAREGAEVVGLDVAPSAVERAREFPPVGSESYHLGDLFALEEQWAGSFDWVWEHTCFCAIDPEQRDAYVRAVRGALVKDGGRLLGAFYLDPYDREHPRGEGPPHGCTVDEIERRFGGAFRILESFAPLAAYPGREGREQMILMERR